VQSTKAYIIIGTTGEYADRQQWIVYKVFYSRENAEALANQLDELGRVGERVGDYHFMAYAEKQDGVLHKLQQLDPKAKLDPFTGTKYSVEECDIF